MLGTPLNKRVRRVLAVTVANDLSITTDATDGPYFPAAVQAPQTDNSTGDGSPRVALSPWRLYWSRVPAPLHVCDRVEVPGDATYELLAEPKPVTSGRRSVGFSVPVLPVELLYPRTAELRKLGGGEPLVTVRCAVFAARETQGQRGTYHDTFCELPPEVWQHITPKTNQQLHFAEGEVWALANAAISPEVPFVNAALRRAG